MSNVTHITNHKKYDTLACKRKQAEDDFSEDFIYGLADLAMQLWPFEKYGGVEGFCTVFQAEVENALAAATIRKHERQHEDTNDE